MVEANESTSILQKNDNNEEIYFKKLKDEIKSKLKFDSSRYSDNFLKRRITVRVNANNLESYKRYYEFFLANPQEHPKLLENLTIHVTEFFRDKSLWDFCKTDFFPHALEVFKDKKEIRIWSAGCSSGQEAISILITLLEIKPDIDNIKIICTDISESILKKAKEAVYDSYEITGLPDEFLEKYFDKQEKTQVLKQKYRHFFEHKIQDVLQDDPVKNIDILFFRNTVIYFSKDSKEALYKKFHDHLNQPSFLVLGKTESLSGESRVYFDSYNVHERIFSKKE